MKSNSKKMVSPLQIFLNSPVLTGNNPVATKEKTPLKVWHRWLRVQKS